MKGLWKIESNLIGAQKMYRIYRLLDTAKVDHSGNREYAGEYVEDRKTLEIVVEQMNQKESPREGD